jgi:apolipoprotein N-acyltransferase
MQFTVLRAVENRRWFLQCANGGISFFVDPSGRIRKETGLFTDAILTGEVTPATELTFYSRHGDWFAEIMLVVGFLVTGLAVIHTVYRKRGEGRR